MTDVILLSGVRARGFHGVLAHEKADGQDFVVDVELTVDLASAGETDSLEETVNYAQVAAEVVAAVHEGSLDLIESLAARIAERVLARPLVEAAQVTVHKPQAPVGVPFGDVAVRIRRERDVPVVLALGGNLGDVPATLGTAVRRLVDLGVRPTAVSPLFETDPLGEPGQDCYLNAVVLARTAKPPRALLRLLHRVEAEQRRRRDVRWGARTLDLDLVQYGEPGEASEVVCDLPDLVLPHPRAHERAFVLQPWLAVDRAAVLRVGEDLVPVADLAGSAAPGAGIRPGPPWRPPC